MKNNEKRRGFTSNRFEGSIVFGRAGGGWREKGKRRKREAEGERAEREGRGRRGTAKSVADWRPQARLQIPGVMPVIRGFGAQ